MAFLVQRGADRIEIRESVSTPRGPRSRLLASFSEPLTPDVLERAAARATRPFDRQALIRRARAAGIEIFERSRESEMRACLARLRRGDPVDPVLAAVLREALTDEPDEPVPEELAEVSAWVGASSAARGAALRELLDLYGQVASSRAAPRQRRRPRFPRFSSRRKAG
jgi:hypothetical protein